MSYCVRFLEAKKELSIEKVMQNVPTVQSDYSSDKKTDSWHFLILIQGASLRRFKGFKEVFMGLKFAIINSNTHT